MKESQTLKRPTFQDVLKARKIVSKYLLKTPLLYSAPLSQMLGCEVSIKYENHQPIGAFKIRGGINLLASLKEEGETRGVMTASTGNHGQSIAYAAKLFGIPAIIVVPEESNPDKVAAMRNLGAEIIFYGKDFDESRVRCEALALEKGYRYVHPANEPRLIAGVGTIGLEILEDLPDVDVIISPIGGGSGVCGNAIVAKAINPKIRVIGVQAEKAPAVYLSWKAGKMVETARSDTFAEGLATRVPFELTFGMISDLIDEIVLVSEEEMRRAILLLLEKTHHVAEGAGAASTAAALKMKESLRGKKVALVLSGGNLPLSTLKQIINESEPW
ncbi:MAG: threonine dehydratase [Candidatus Tectomicrobia bacterium]|nr:threonine dehydratase [Candidatus Tectomicrobia bacterium]